MCSMTLPRSLEPRKGEGSRLQTVCENFMCRFAPICFHTERSHCVLRSRAQPTISHPKQGGSA